MRAKDRTWSSYPYPADEGLSWNLIVLHGPEADQGAGSAEASFAVNRNGSSIRFGKVLVSNLHELLDDVIGRCAPIDEKKIVVFDIIVNKVFLVVLRLIQAYHPVHTEFVEDVNIHLGLMSVSLGGIPLLNRPHKSHELAWNDPVEVAVLHLLVVFVFFDIEGLEVVPPEINCVFESLKNLQDGALVQTVAFRGVSIGLK